MVGKTNTWLNRVGSNDVGKLHAPNTAGRKHIGTAQHSTDTLTHSTAAALQYHMHMLLNMHYSVTTQRNNNIFRTNKEYLRPAANAAGKSGSHRPNILIKNFPATD